MTREQIGAALEYDDPRKRIAVIHTRNKDRLDSLSRRFQIETPSGIQEMIVYTLRGAMEICRYSRQPKAPPSPPFFTYYRAMLIFRRHYAILPLRECDLPCLNSAAFTASF